MRKALAVAATLVGVGVVIQRLRLAVPRIDWEKRFERLPDNAPPKWMFRNITAIRENTDQILELLQSERADSATASGRAPTE